MGKIPEYDSQKAKQVDKALEKELNMKHLNFPNGKVNQAYQAYFLIEQLELDWIDEFYFEGLEDIGLKYNEKKCLIEGHPFVPGDHIVRLCCKRTGWRHNMPILNKEIIIIINPDPRSLWKNIPTDSSVEYFRPDSESIQLPFESNKEIEVSGKIIVAASQRGRSHAHEGTPRDDAFALELEDGWYLICIADGAGSASYSREGARIACNSIITYMKERKAILEQTLIPTITKYIISPTEKGKTEIQDCLFNIIEPAVVSAYTEIQKEADNTSRSIKDYASTLLTTVCKQVCEKWFIASFGIGDGAIGIYNNYSQWLKIMNKPDGGEFAGQTLFLITPEMVASEEIRSRISFEIVDDFTALILMTDGVTDAKFQTDAGLHLIENWNHLWADLNAEIPFYDKRKPTAKMLEEWLNFWSPGNHDDRTIAILY